ncbi:MAG: hypothetical protein RL119_755, partial [Actinomycetota bacterium]
LPVSHPGAMLFLGDGHALQGDGEPTGNGVETSMDVEFSVAIRKAATVNRVSSVTTVEAALAAVQGMAEQTPGRIEVRSLQEHHGR